ncbi:MAG: hypothetical protein IPN46_08635 [Saprospiraceae bacterium]|nr:hypothetical protein [Saprospiraceae bacterium]
MDPNLFFQTITSHLGDINIAASDLGIRWVKLNSEHKTTIILIITQKRRQVN